MVAGRCDMREFYSVPYLGDKALNRRDIFTVRVPGSKSVTNRALLLAAMANGVSTLRGCLTSDDAKHFLSCIRDLGFETEIIMDYGMNISLKIKGEGGVIPKKQAEIYVGSAGTAARFLVAMLSFSDGEYVINSSEQMKKRPMKPLIDAVTAAGAEVICLESEGHFPLKIIGAKKRGADIPSKITVDIGKSSQFLSALLIAAGTLDRDIEITAVGNHGLSYVDMTLKMMNSFGVCASHSFKGGNNLYTFNGGKGYKACDYGIEPDMSAAAYFYAMAALLKVKIAVMGVSLNMLQGDTAFLNLLSQMGCKLYTYQGNAVIEGGSLQGGFEADMSAFSDQALTLAAIAPYADTPIRITGIAHIRLQECDRIAAIRNNLNALGISTESDDVGVTIFPAKTHGGEIETYDDHRVAMSFALTGLLTDGVIIKNPDCCKKTFAQFFEVLEEVIEQITEDM